MVLFCEGNNRFNIKLKMEKDLQKNRVWFDFSCNLKVDKQINNYYN